MAFHDDPFPDCSAFDSMHAVTGRTAVVSVMSGSESRNADWSKRRRRFDLAQAVKSQQDADAVIAHFECVDARLDTFPYKDPTDFAVSLAEGRATAITSTTFRLQKAYGSGSRTRLRDIRLPEPDQVLVSGVAAVWSLDPDTGVVTIAAAPIASSITWSGEFSNHVRYDTDELRYSVVDRNPDEGLLYAFESIPLVEVINE